MAVAFGNLTTDGVQDDEGAAALSCTKPTGLSEGDFMVFVGTCAINTQSEAAVRYTRTGWTNLAVQIHSIQNLTTSVICKVASSADVLLSSFSFTNNVSNATQFGFMFNVTGSSFTGSGNISHDIEEASTTATPSYTGGLIPPGSSSLLALISVVADDNVTGSSYAVANNNPATWTERLVDDFDLDTRKIGYMVATSAYASSGSTGNFSLTFSESEGSIGLLLAISESASATGTAEFLAVDPTFFNPNGLADTLGTVALLEVDPTFFNPAGKSIDDRWTDQNKPETPTWTDKKKY